MWRLTNVLIVPRPTNSLAPHILAFDVGQPECGVLLADLWPAAGRKVCLDQLTTSIRRRKWLRWLMYTKYNIYGKIDAYACMVKIRNLYIHDALVRPYPPPHSRRNENSTDLDTLKIRLQRSRAVQLHHLHQCGYATVWTMKTMEIASVLAINPKCMLSIFTIFLTFSLQLLFSLPWWLYILYTI